MAKRKSEKEKKEEEDLFLKILIRESRTGESIRQIFGKDNGQRLRYVRWKKKHLESGTPSPVPASGSTTRAANSNAPQVVINNHVEEFDYDKFFEKVAQMKNVDIKTMEKAVYYAVIEGIAAGNYKAMDIAFKMLCKISPRYQTGATKSNPQDFQEIWNDILDRKKKRSTDEKVVANG